MRATYKELAQKYKISAFILKRAQTVAKEYNGKWHEAIQHFQASRFHDPSQWLISNYDKIIERDGRNRYARPERKAGQDIKRNSEVIRASLIKMGHMSREDGDEGARRKARSVLYDASRLISRYIPPRIQTQEERDLIKYMPCSSCGNPDPPQDGFKLFKVKGYMPYGVCDECLEKSEGTTEDMIDWSILANNYYVYARQLEHDINLIPGL
jgi:hypothetical protein